MHDEVTRSKPEFCGSSAFWGADHHAFTSLSFLCAVVSIGLYNGPEEDFGLRPAAPDLSTRWTHQLSRVACEPSFVLDLKNL
jgi:hypothetical protein